MQSKKKIFQNSFLYVFSTLLIRATGFLLLPIYTIFLTPEDYGITNLSSSFISVGIYIVGFALYSAIIRFYAEYKNDELKIKKLFGTLFSFVFISGFISLGLGVLFKNTIIELFFKGIDFFPIILITLLILVFQSLHTLHQSMLQGMQEGKKLTIINIIVFIMMTLLKLLFIGFLELGAVGFLLAQLIVYVSYGLFLLYDLSKNKLVIWGIDSRILKEALLYSIPLLPHELSTRIASYASQLFINVSSNLSNVGLYSIAMQFGTIIDVVQVSVNQAFQPWFFEMMENDDEKVNKEIVNLSSVLLLMYSLIYMLIGLFSQEVIILMTSEDYIMSWTIIPILVIGFSFKSIYFFYVNIMLYFKEASKKLFIATIAGSFSDILLAYILIPYLGLYGSALAFSIAKIITVIIVSNISKSYADIGYKVIDMLKIILPSLVFMAIGLFFSYTKYTTVFNWYNLVYKMIVLFIYILFIYFTNKSRVDNVIKMGILTKIFKNR